MVPVIIYRCCQLSVFDGKSANGHLSVFDGKSARFWFWTSLCVCDHSVSRCCQLSVFDGRSAMVRVPGFGSVVLDISMCV